SSLVARSRVKQDTQLWVSCFFIRKRTRCLRPAPEGIVDFRPKSVYHSGKGGSRYEAVSGGSTDVSAAVVTLRHSLLCRRPL
ncbi:Immunity protein 17, partial [Dysosmobacter welbionis]